MTAKWEDEYELPDEIDFSRLKRVPNPFTQKFRHLNLVSLDSDVHAAFSNSAAVNKALRGLLEQQALKKAS